jgi:hypothetical protein
LFLVNVTVGAPEQSFPPDSAALGSGINTRPCRGPDCLSGRKSAVGFNPIRTIPNKQMVHGLGQPVRLQPPALYTGLDFRF